MRRSAMVLGLVVMMLIPLMGCGGDGDSGSLRGLSQSAGLTRAPILPDGQGQARVFIGFQGPPGAVEEALVKAAGGKVHHAYQIVPAVAATLPQAAIEALQRNPRVAYIEGDLECHALGEVLPWGVNRIGAPAVHAGGNQGAGVKVAVIDSGIDYTHEDLGANYVAGGLDYVNNDADPRDDNGHGTHVAGTIAAVDNELGVIGVAPEAQLYACKVLNANGSGYFSWTVAALDWCAGHDIQVANMSLGSSLDPGITVANACQAAYNAGVVLVAAAGNDGNRRGTGDSIDYPARYPSVIAVGATDSSDLRAYFSSTGSALELMAPGVYIYSTYLSGAGNPTGYATMSGTSMASPHVAGVAALVIAANEGITAPQVRTRLIDTADPLGTATQYGYGLVDAVGAAGAPPPPPPPPPGTGTMHVASIDLSASVAGKNINATATVRIVDEAIDPVDSATVTGDWSLNGTVFKTNVSAATDSNGGASIGSGRIKGSGVLTFEVTEVSHASLTYDPSANSETSDSITVP